MNLNSVPAGPDIPNDIYVIIEIPAYSKPIKYEINKKTGIVFVDRIMYSTIFYPCNYGYINHTISLDGDPIDVLVSTPHPLQIGSVIRCRPIGIFKMTDEKGEDHKIIAVPHKTISKNYENIKDINDLSNSLKKQIEYFFKHYKILDDDKWTTIQGWENKESAKNEILSSFQRSLTEKSKL